MTKKELIAALAEYPDDAVVELGKFLAVDGEEAFEVRLDFPIAGLGYNDKELIFVVATKGDSKPWLLKFGKVTRLGE